MKGMSSVLRRFWKYSFHHSKNVLSKCLQHLSYSEDCVIEAMLTSLEAPDGFIESHLGQTKVFFYSVPILLPSQSFFLYNCLGSDMFGKVPVCCLSSPTSQLNSIRLLLFNSITLIKSHSRRMKSLRWYKQQSKIFTLPEEKEMWSSHSLWWTPIRQLRWGNTTSTSALCLTQHPAYLIELGSRVQVMGLGQPDYF